MLTATSIIQDRRSRGLDATLEEKIEQEYQIQQWIDYTAAQTQYESDLPLELRLKYQHRMKTEYEALCKNA